MGKVTCAMSFLEEGLFRDSSTYINICNPPFKQKINKMKDKNHTINSLNAESFLYVVADTLA